MFKTITVDNGSEFADFAQCENWDTEVFFAHPYTSWERAQNERHNGLFRAFVPKGASMEHYSAEYILSAADALNARPRKKLGYATPEELFDLFLDRVYATGSKPSLRRTIFSCGYPTCTCNLHLFNFESSGFKVNLICFEGNIMNLNNKLPKLGSLTFRTIFMLIRHARHPARSQAHSLLC
ncbi:IS30 family transposase [Ruminococcus champanellensis]|uniref:IS30 family transposase n=1 Tax=Ruminococcus champanellensis TaxID=1161942 RepID=UPI0039F4EA4F